MDLGSECSALESEEENEGNREKLHRDEENVYENNGSFAGENIELGLGGNSDANASMVELASEQHVHPTRTGPSATKGFGLKKWKRIRRDVVKDPNSCVDSSRILKRGLFGNASLAKSHLFLPDVKQNSEGSIGSSNMSRNVGFSDGYAIHVSSSDSVCAFGSGFALGTGFENSEDRSSKSSMAASAPKLRYDLPAVLGHVHEKSQNKNMNSKNLANSAQQFQQGRRQIESSKKPRGERVKMEKENSHSSMESDSRSYIKQCISTMTCSGKHSGWPNIFDRGNSEEAHTNEHFSKENQAGYCNENVREEENLLQENIAENLSGEVKEEKSENNQPSAVGDPLIESVYSLEAVQEALEEEVRKFRVIENEPLSPDGESTKCSNAAADVTTVDLRFQKSYLSGQSVLEGIKETASSSLELQVLILGQNVNILENKLEELQGMLVLKDSRIVELETALSSGEFPREEPACTLDLSEEKYKEESELEDLFRQKIETEVEYLAITKMMHNLKVAAGFQLTLLKEQETLSGNQAQVLNKLGEVESKASMMQTKADELEKHCDDILGVEETLKMQKRVWKVTFCLSMQFMLFIFVFCLSVSRLLPNFGVVPT